MKLSLLLPLLLLGAVSARHLDPQASLNQDLESSGEQEGELALPEERIPAEEEEALASGYQDAFEHEDNMDSDSDVPEDVQCPKEEETVQIQGTPEAKTYRHVLVRSPQTFYQAEITCRRCYRGRLVSIHNSGINYHLHCLARGINQGQVWIGATCNNGLLCSSLRWTDGSVYNFSNWASGQPYGGRGNCVTLCTRGGQWRRAQCARTLPFICAV